jgi:hypothetical protein
MRFDLKKNVVESARPYVQAGEELFTCYSRTYMKRPYPVPKVGLARFTFLHVILQSKHD